MNLFVATLETHWKKLFMKCYLQVQYRHDPKLRSEKQRKDKLRALRSEEGGMGRTCGTCRCRREMLTGF